MKTNNYKREIPSFINKYKIHILVLIATLGIGLVGCENKVASKAAGEEPQEYYRFTSIVAGGEYTVRLAEDGSLWSWGYNAFSQLGDGLATDRNTPVRVQQKGKTVGTFEDNTTKWKAVSVGENHTVGIDSDGTLWSWGYNGNGKLGDGTITNKSTPVRVKQETEEGAFEDNTTKWKAVSAGDRFTVVIDSDGTLWSWGYNGNGQLGDGTKTDKSTPVRVQKTGITWKAVSVGVGHTVGIDINGTLWSWGKNNEGQLGDGTKTDKSTPVRVQQKTEEGAFEDNTTKWKAVSAGDRFTVGIDSDGTLWSWGYNGNGQLGDGTKIGKSTPVRVQKTGITWKAVSAGEGHTVGIDSDGNLWSWGGNGNGELGDGTTGTTANKSTPVRVKQAGGTAEPFVDNTTKWKAVSAGEGHTVGIDSDGNLWAWGRNNKGQLGDGTATDRNTPVKIQIPE